MHLKNELTIRTPQSGDPSHENTAILSSAEHVFDTLKIYSEGFKSTFFTNKDLANLCLTSKTLNSIASPELNRRMFQAQILLAYVVLGEQENAQSLIEENPQLLLIRTKAIDYSKRTIIATPFQAAIGAGDKHMWEMILPYFEGLEQGELVKQFHGQFPNGIEDDFSAEHLRDYYNAIASAIIYNKDYRLAIIKKFREEISSKMEIRQGKHFTLQHPIAAYQTYIDNFDAFGTEKNRSLFFQNVICFVLRQMTIHDAKKYYSEIEKILNDESLLAKIFSSYDAPDDDNGAFCWLSAQVLRKLYRDNINALEGLKASLGLSKNWGASIVNCSLF
ncbi:hypothetical protein [Fluoribacter gormanii]|uniref:hypothetical protein n=1 Tax=Fluoribacter gormanii TaxID=464 RepID=UPI001040E3F5|nr:hypothetical protein [Fluoribacter gormanii]